MKNELQIIAMYRDKDDIGEFIKVLTMEKALIYEILVIKDINGWDKIIINPYVLTYQIKLAKEEIIKNARIAVKVLREILKSSNPNVRISSTRVTKELKESLEDYDYIELNQDLYKEYLGREQNVQTLTKDKQDYSRNLEDFFHEYETKELRLKRFYSKQRTNRIDWDTYFMAIAKLSAKRSKDPSTQVGSVIVDKNHRILSIGYNGAPIGMDDDYFPWEREGVLLHTKYLYVCHAEMNAIINYRGSRKDLEGSTIYVDLFPCNECAKMIVQAGIKEVVYLSDKYADTDATIASKRIFDVCGIIYRQLDEKYQTEITLSLKNNK